MAAKELYLTDEMIDGVLIIHVGGHIDGINAQEFQKELVQRIKEADGSVVLDFQNLSYISSAGLRSILFVEKVFRDKNAKFVLCSLPETALQVIRISGFDKIIEIQESRSLAIAAATN